LYLCKKGDIAGAIREIATGQVTHAMKESQNSLTPTFGKKNELIKKLEESEAYRTGCIASFGK
jgi:hypothetical protein